jgi:hypothetical protein
MPKAHDLTGDLRKLRNLEAKPKGARAKASRAVSRKGYRSFATDWGVLIGWSFGAALFLLQFAVLGWIAL